MPNYHYGNAQICEKGHIISSDIVKYPTEKKSYCPKCGASTIAQCPHCQALIQGDYYVEEVAFSTCGSFEYDDSMPLKSHTSYKKIRSVEIPSYCNNCGMPFPWTEDLLNAADKIIELSDELSNEQREQLKACFPNLINNTMESNVSALRFSKIFPLLNPLAQSALKNLLIEYLSATILTLIGWKSS